MSNNTLKLLEELDYWGTPIDQTILEAARTAARGLKITDTGNPMENVVYARASGGVSVMMSVAIEHISERVIPVSAVRLKMPWSDADFQWQSAKDLDEWGDYVVPELGTYGFPPSVVLNHRLLGDRKFFPGDSMEGLLLGHGKTSIPDHYADRRRVQMQLVIYTTLNRSYGGWIELGVDRGAQRETHKLQECGAARKRPRVPLFTAKDMRIAD